MSDWAVRKAYRRSTLTCSRRLYILAEDIQLDPPPEEIWGEERSLRDQRRLHSAGYRRASPPEANDKNFPSFTPLG